MKYRSDVEILTLYMTYSDNLQHLSLPNLTSQCQQSIISDFLIPIILNYFWFVFDMQLSKIIIIIISFFSSLFIDDVLNENYFIAKSQSLNHTKVNLQDGKFLVLYSFAKNMTPSFKKPFRVSRKLVTPQSFSHLLSTNSISSLCQYYNNIQL